MDADFKSRKQVNYDQMNGLLDFLQEHPDLAKGLTRGRRGKMHSLKLWNLCAKKVNPIKDGATKDGRGWSKYWCDWKYRVRRKALELKAANDNNRPPPDGVVPLTQMEDCLLGLIGASAVEGVIIKSDPLGDGVTDDEADNNEDTPSGNQNRGTPSKSSKRSVCKRRHSSGEPSELGGHAGPSSPPDRKPRTDAASNGADDSDHDDDSTSEFLRLERENLKNTKLILESIRTIASQIGRMADAVNSFRDFLINNSINRL